MHIGRVPTIRNVPLPTAGVEVEEVIVIDSQEAIKKLQLKSQGMNTLQYGYVPGGPYVTIPIGFTYWWEHIDGWHITLYLVGSVNGQIAELEYWV